MPGIAAVPTGQDRPQLRRARLPGGQDELRVGRTVVLAQRPGQVPGVQVPFGAGGARHRAHGDVGPLVPMVRQVPALRQPPAVGPRGLCEGHDVLRSWRVRQRGKLGGVLPGQLARERVRGRVGRHQPREPAGRGVVEVLVIVVGDAPQVTREIRGPPLGARRRREPGRVGEMGGQLADHRDPVAVSGQDARARYATHLRLRRLVLLRFTVPLPAGYPGNRFAKPPGQPACQS